MADTGRCGDSGNDLSYLQGCAEDFEILKGYELHVYGEPPNKFPGISCDNNITVLTCEKAFKYIW